MSGPWAVSPSTIRAPEIQAWIDYTLEGASQQQVALALESAALTEDLLRRQSEARFRSLIQNSSDVVTVIDPDTTRHVDPCEVPTRRCVPSPPPTDSRAPSRPVPRHESPGTRIQPGGPGNLT